MMIGLQVYTIPNTTTSTNVSIFLYHYANCPFHIPSPYPHSQPCPFLSKLSSIEHFSCLVAFGIFMLLLCFFSHLPHMRQIMYLSLSFCLASLHLNDIAANCMILTFLNSHAVLYWVYIKVSLFSYLFWPLKLLTHFDYDE